MKNLLSVSGDGVFNDLHWGEFLLSFVSGFLVPLGVGLSSGLPLSTTIKASLGAGVMSAGWYLRNPKKLPWESEKESAAEQAESPSTAPSTPSPGGTP